MGSLFFDHLRSLFSSHNTLIILKILLDGATSSKKVDWNDLLLRFASHFRFQLCFVESFQFPIDLSTKERRCFKFAIAGIRTYDLPHPRSREFDALDRSATVGLTSWFFHGCLKLFNGYKGGATGKYGPFL